MAEAAGLNPVMYGFESRRAYFYIEYIYHFNYINFIFLIKICLIFNLVFMLIKL